MNVALMGATGMVGSKILLEALERGHKVAAISRHPEKISPRDGVTGVRCEVLDTAGLSAAFAGRDAVIHSYAPPPDPVVAAYVMAAVAAGQDRFQAFRAYAPVDPAAHDAHVKGRIDAQTAGTRSIVAAAKAAGVKRILAVGGAGTLLIDGVRTMDRPEFFKAFEGGAKSTAVVKEILKEHPELDWTVLCPSTSIFPGTRTGKFRLGLDDLLTAPDGTSSISLEDFAMAMIDEVENPRHTRKRFTAGY